jgi:hypothetical protein
VVLHGALLAFSILSLTCDKKARQRSRAHCPPNLNRPTDVRNYRVCFNPLFPFFPSKNSSFRTAPICVCGLYISIHGVLIHCSSRLSPGVAILAAELLRGDGVFTKWTREGPKAVHHL